MNDQTEQWQPEDEQAGLSQENGRKMGEVGPGKPPVEHQFQPGHPGGPGRPKGSKSLKRLLNQRLQENDGELAQVIIDHLVRRIKIGDSKTIKMMIDLSD